MADFRTGRQRRLLASGTFAYEHRVDEYPVPYPPGGSPPNAGGGVSITAPWVEPPEHSGTSESNGKFGGTKISCCDGYNAPVLADNSYPYGPTPIEFEQDIAGTYTFYLDVEEWCHIDDLAEYDPDSVDSIDGVDFPNFGGSAMGDGCPANYCYFYEQARLGGTSFAQLTDNFGSVSSTHVLVAGDVLSISNGYLMQYEPSIGALSCSASAQIVEESWGGSVSPAYSETIDLPPYGSIYGYSDGATTSVTANGSGEVSIEVTANVQPPDNYAVDVRSRCFANSSPFALNLQLQDKRRFSGGTYNLSSILITANPEYVGTINQQTYLVGGVYSVGGSGSTTPMPQVLAAERCPVRVWVDSSAFPPDDSRDWRCSILGKCFPSFNLHQDSSVAVSSGGSITGPISLSQQRWDGYRFLQFSADQAGTLVVTNPQGQTKKYPWKITTPGSAQTVTLDLCSPYLWSVGKIPNPDIRASRFPLVSPSSGITATEVDEMTMVDDAKGSNWGIFKAASLAVSAIGGGGSTPSVNIGTMSLIQKSNAFATFLPKFLPDFYLWTDSSSTTYSGAPFLTAESDGKQCFDWPAAELVSPSGGSPGFNFETLTSLISLINYIPGWHATAVTSFPSDGYHNNSLPAFFAMGSGAVKPSATVDWIEGVDMPITSTNTLIYAQDLFDQVQGYPGIGDVWSGAAYGAMSAPMPINMTKFLRAQSWGLTFDVTDGSPLADATVSATEYVSPYASYGTGTSDSQGEYKTLATYVPGNVDYKTEMEEGVTPYPFTHRAWLNRGRLRVTFGGQQKPCPGPQRR